MVKLIAEGGTLSLPGDEMLIYRYHEGDYDLIEWPQYNPVHLARALYDAVECGQMPDERTVELPDGSLFNIDEHVE